MKVERDGLILSPESTIKAIAGELNQPLFAIAINADAVARMLGSNPQDVAAMRAALADIGNDALRISRGIATVQRLLAGDHESPSDIDVAQLVNDSLSQLQNEMLVQRVACEIDTEPRLPGVRGVRPQLMQMLVNLMVNSLDAMSGPLAQERRLRVQARLHDARAVCIRVEDSGVGIRPEDRTRVFDPFFTTKPQRSGLGLAICRNIVDAHGGNISVADRPGPGAAFMVVLPASS